MIDDNLRHSIEKITACVYKCLRSGKADPITPVLINYDDSLLTIMGCKLVEISSVSARK